MMHKLVVLLLCLPAVTPIWQPNRCPRQCHCTVAYNQWMDVPLNTVDCANLGLTSFPSPGRIPADAQVLRLDGNAIDALDGEMRLYLPELLLLNLSGNALAAIPSSRPLLEGLEKCRLIDLSYNRLTVLGSNTFEGLMHLETLLLSHNRIATLLPHSLRGLSSLLLLDMSFNDLPFVHEEMWMEVVHLADLDLSHNRIHFVQRNAFRPLRRLARLSLAHNGLQAIHDDGFGGLWRMGSIDLGHNRLTEFPKNSLNSVRRTLLKLTIDDNPIRVLSPNALHDFPSLLHFNMRHMPLLLLVREKALSNLQSLHVVNMHSNPRLAYIDEGAMKDTPNIGRLLLHGNNLSVVEEGVVHGLTKLRYVTVHGNPLRCEGQMAWLEVAIERGVVGEMQRILQCPNRLTSTPLIIPILPTIVTLTEGHALQLPCRASGSPRPHISWEGGLPSSARLEDGGRTMVVTKIKGSNASFTCVATSSMGKVRRTTIVNVLTTTPSHWSGDEAHNDRQCVLRYWPWTTVGTSICLLLLLLVAVTRRAMMGLRGRRNSKTSPCRTPLLIAQSPVHV